MASASENLISQKELFERLIKIETAFNLKCIENEKALVLARELIARESCHFAEQLDVKLHNMNNFQHRIDKLTGTLVTKEELEKEVKIVREQTDGKFSINAGRINDLSRLLYIGIGLVLALEMALKYLFK